MYNVRDLPISVPTGAAEVYWHEHACKWPVLSDCKWKFVLSSALYAFHSPSEFWTFLHNDRNRSILED